MHQIMCVILVTNSELLKLACNVVGCSAVHVLVRVYPIIGGSRTCILGVALALIAFIIVVLAMDRLLAPFATDLARHLVARSSLVCLLGRLVAPTTTSTTITTATKIVALTSSCFVGQGQVASTVVLLK